MVDFCTLMKPMYALSSFSAVGDDAKPYQIRAVRAAIQEVSK